MKILPFTPMTSLDRLNNLLNLPSDKNRYVSTTTIVTQELKPQHKLYKNTVYKMINNIIGNIIKALRRK